MTHPQVYYVRKWRPDWFKRPCRVVASGALGSVLIEFAGGERAVVNWRSVRRPPKPRAAKPAAAVPSLLDGIE